MLFLGAGVSSGFGLPSWIQLIGRILEKTEDATFMEDLSKKSDKDLAKMVDPFDDESPSYVTKVHKALYSQVVPDVSTRLAQSSLLLGVAALMTGSCRGRINCVMTYNYDDLLRQYLRMLGYSVCVRVLPTDLSTWCDVEINHIHGYLPQFEQNGSKGEDLVLSEKSYRKRRAFIGEGWSSYVEKCLYSRIGLFLGLSGDDSTILDILKRAQRGIRRACAYTGYWLMTPDAYARNHQSILDVGMCPICLPVQSFPEFIFGVCEKAG